LPIYEYPSAPRRASNTKVQPPESRVFAGDTPDAVPQPRAANPDGGRLLVLNAGSSSLKFALYPIGAGGPGDGETRGAVDGIGREARLTIRRPGRAAESREAGSLRDARSALDAVFEWLVSENADVAAVGHRVVHGGARRTGPAAVTPELLDELRALVPLAPLHQPHNLEAIEAAADRFPGVPQAASFDTAFHRGRPELADLVPLPQEIRRAGVQRYGFHGLSYEYIAGELPRAAPAIAGGRVIVAHLGSGASLCALRGGRAVDTTMGFTALDGLCMGTRPGSLDPGVVLYLFQSLGLPAERVEELLYEESGLRGISGVGGDMRELLASAVPAARLAVDYFVRRAAMEIGALAAVLGGVDGLVFTAGIGENSPPIRTRIGEACRWLGLEVDDAANADHGPRISRPDSRVSAWVIPTDEERMIARHAAEVLGLARVG
jgi:acetate kinase